MQQHFTHSSDRLLALGMAAISAGAMFYVGLYQSRAVRHLWCPIFKKGCEAVADAAFANGDNGIIATCFHVVKDSESSVAVGVQYEDRVDLSKPEINLGERASFKARLLASDKDLDIAILKAATSLITTLPCIATVMNS